MIEFCVVVAWLTIAWSVWTILAPVVNGGRGPVRRRDAVDILAALFWPVFLPWLAVAIREDEIQFGIDRSEIDHDG